MNKSLEQYMPDGSKLPYRFMKYRIHKILLVCCSYDGYILEEDGHIESQINQESSRGYLDYRAEEALKVFADWMKYNSRSIYGCTMAEPEFKGRKVL